MINTKMIPWRNRSGKSFLFPFRKLGTVDSKQIANTQENVLHGDRVPGNFLSFRFRKLGTI